MNADARGWAGGPAWCCTAKPGRPILMSSAGALAHVPSACIGVHLPASALDACLLAPPRAAPICKVARSLSPNQNSLAPCDEGRDGGSDPPRGSSAATPHVQRYGLGGVSKLPASAMPCAAKSPCTNSARHDDGGKELPHEGQAAPPRLARRRSAYGMAARAHAPERAGAVGSRPGRCDPWRYHPMSSGAVGQLPPQPSPQDAMRSKDPIHQEQLPDRRRPPSHPKRDETMVRLARERSGRQFR
jgi:hypothetical protein